MFIVLHCLYHCGFRQGCEFGFYIQFFVVAFLSRFIVAFLLFPPAINIICCGIGGIWQSCCPVDSSRDDVYMHPWDKLSIVKMVHLIKITHLFTVLVPFPAGSSYPRGMREVGLCGAAIVDSIGVLWWCRWKIINFDWENGKMSQIHLPLLHSHCFFCGNIPITSGVRGVCGWGCYIGDSSSVAVSRRWAFKKVMAEHDGWWQVHAGFFLLFWGQ